MSGTKDGSSVDDGFQRPVVHGKFVYCGGTKLWIRGVSYGPFHPNERGHEFHDRHCVERDLTVMSANGINAIRTYTVPPLWLLDLACKHRMHVMVGLPWEQHIAFLDDRRRIRSIRASVRSGVRACAGHPAVLCYGIGNEIPAPIARWHGARRIEQYLRSLHTEAKEEDPHGLFTYVNYPSTEYLELDFVDLVCFNVYLETQQSVSDYIARLHNIAGDRPLVITEFGLDSLGHGEDSQARVLDWQVRTAFAEGCAGAFVFSWTDEWYRGGHDISDWAFGLTDRQRREKPALAAVSRAFAEVPFPPEQHWPAISIIVCSCNGARTIRECFQALLKLDYPNYEVIVVDDGSTDATAEIAASYPFRLIRTPNRGLSSARNTGLRAATGEIVAYIDDDAYPDSHWLTYLATTFLTTTHVGVGGPNIPPSSDGLIAECVAIAPGGPIHVLISDREAEHIPGCNMSFRKDYLEAIGGFDPRFHVAGDDVDVCWGLQQYGWTLGFSPSAVVWHHRRNSIRAYWRQQCGYGKAEALLEAKWPGKYNTPGHVVWTGRIYSPVFSRAGGRFRRIFHGVWGSALFQSVYQPAPGSTSSLLLMPEWYLVIACLAAISGAGIFWKPLLVAFPLLIVAAGGTVVQATVRGVRASFTTKQQSRTVRLELGGLTAFLYLLQPLARLYGRLREGLTPWRRRGVVQSWAWPRPQLWTIWSEGRLAPDDWLRALETDLIAVGSRVIRGGDYDRWDIEVSNGTFGSVRILNVIEEHGAGKQMARFRLSPRCSRWFLSSICFLVALAGMAAWQGGWRGLAVVGALALLFTLRTAADLGVAMAAVLHVLGAMKKKIEDADVCRVPAAPSDSIKAIELPNSISLGPDCDEA
jgi:cellulose synthase/poly-beta-1,6-N-acetylglucosamine synthase-like glycosyltransferase